MAVEHHLPGAAVLPAPRTASADVAGAVAVRDDAAPPVPRDRAARAVAAAALAVTAAVHVPVGADHVAEHPALAYAMYAFVLLAAAAAGSLLVESRTATWAGVLVLGAAAVAAYALSRTVGLLGEVHDVGAWADPLGVVCVAAELLAAGTAAAVLLRRRRG